MYASDFRRIARNNLSNGWLKAGLVCLIASLLGGLSSSSGINFDSDSLENLSSYLESYTWFRPLLSGIFVYSIIATLISIIVGCVVELGLKKYFLKQYDGKEHSIGDLFSYFGNWGNAFCLRLLTTLYLVLWTLLFIIPGIIKALSYAMAPYIMAEHPDWSANECITRSRELMKGHKFDYFCLGLSFIGWALLCVFTLGIGNFFLNPYRQAADAAFYRNLCAAEASTTEE